MVKSIKQELLVLIKDFRIYFLIQAGAFLGGMIIMFVAQHFVSEQEWFPIGTLISLMMVFIFGSICGATGIYVGFDLALYMGRTRKKYIPSVLSVFFMQMLFQLILFKPMLAFECFIYRKLYPQAVADGVESIQAFLRMPRVIGYAAAITGIIGVSAAIVRKFGKIGGFIVWLLMMCTIWSIDGIAGEKPSNVFEVMGGKIGKIVVNMSMSMQVTILVLAGISGAVIAFFMFRKEAAS